MFIHRKTTQLTHYIVLIMLSLSHQLYGAKPKGKKISAQKGFTMRQKKGECSIPYGGDSWCKAIIISYLYTKKQSSELMKERLKILKEAHNLPKPLIDKKAIELTLDGNAHIKDKKDPNDYIAFVKKHQTSFDHFIQNMHLASENIESFKREDIGKKMQTIANALKKRIQVYTPLKKDFRKLKELYKFTPRVSNLKGPYIRIVLDSYIDSEEKNEEYKEDLKNNHKVVKHYRALISNPKYWKFKSKNANNTQKVSSPISISSCRVEIPISVSSSQELSQLNYHTSTQSPLSQSDDHHKSEEEMSMTVHSPFSFISSETEERKLKNQQIKALDKIEERILKLFKKTIDHFRKSLTTYQIDIAKKCMKIYQTVEQFNLVNSLNDGSLDTWPSVHELITEVKEAVNNINQEVQAIDFSNQAYQEQSKFDKIQFFKLLNKKINFALEASHTWPVQKSKYRQNRSIKRIIMMKIYNEEDEVAEILIKSRLTEQDRKRISTFSETCKIFCENMDEKYFSAEKLELKKYHAQEQY